MTGTAEPVVLVVAGQDDLASDKIVLALNCEGANVVRLDLSAVPLRMACTLRNDIWAGTIHAGDGLRVELEQVGAVLWRWAGTLPGHPAITGPDERLWAARENTDATLGVLRSLPAFWMSHPDRLTAVEGNKPGQLRDAAVAGFTTPATLITTQGLAVSEWATLDIPCIYKAFRATYKPRSGEPGWVLATRLRERLPDELLAASIFQHLIEGTPVRVTVIGENVIAVEVTGVDYDVDWRPEQTRAALREITTPPEAETRIHMLMRRWGLTYGAFDFIRQPCGEWVFLEVNPAGAWGFVEEGADIPLSKMIARTLIEGGRACRN